MAHNIGMGRPKCTRCRYPCKYHQGNTGENCPYEGTPLSHDEAEEAQQQLASMIAQLEELKLTLATDLFNDTEAYIREAEGFEDKVMRADQMYSEMVKEIQEVQRDPAAREHEKRINKELAGIAEEEEKIRKVEERLKERRLEMAEARRQERKTEAESIQSQRNLEEYHRILKEKYRNLPNRKMGEAETDRVESAQKMADELVEVLTARGGTKADNTEEYFKMVRRRFEVSKLPKVVTQEYVEAKRGLAQMVEDEVVLWHTTQSQEEQEKLGRR